MKDIVNKKIELKWSLPEKFVLKKFSGVGKIYYYPAFHSPDWTEFFLIGSFKIITNLMERLCALIQICTHIADTAPKLTIYKIKPSSLSSNGKRSRFWFYKSIFFRKYLNCPR